MGGVWRFHLGALFVEQFRALNSREQHEVRGYMSAILAGPRGPAAHIRPLPPMHMPGTMEAAYGQMVIRYFIEHDDESGDHQLTFLRIRRRW